MYNFLTASPINRADSDIHIVRDVLEGHIGSFELLMRRYNNRLYRVARGVLSDQDEAMDVVQASWIAAYRRLGTFKGPQGFGSWVSRITHNNALMRLRKQERIEYQSENDLERAAEESSADMHAIDEIAQHQLGKILEKAVEELPIKYRSVFVLRAVQQLDTRETAASLNLNESTVKQRFLRAKRMLQISLMRQAEDSSVTIWEFAGARCDRIVKNVFADIKRLQS